MNIAPTKTLLDPAKLSRLDLRTLANVEHLASLGNVTPSAAHVAISMGYGLDAGRTACSLQRLCQAGKLRHLPTGRYQLRDGDKPTQVELYLAIERLERRLR